MDELLRAIESRKPGTNRAMRRALKKDNGAYGRDEVFRDRVNPRAAADALSLRFAPHARNPGEGKSGTIGGGNFDATNTWG